MRSINNMNMVQPKDWCVGLTVFWPFLMWSDSDVINDVMNLSLVHCESGIMVVRKLRKLCRDHGWTRISGFPKMKQKTETMTTACCNLVNSKRKQRNLGKQTANVNNTCKPNIYAYIHTYICSQPCIHPCISWRYAAPVHISDFLSYLIPLHVSKFPLITFICTIASQTVCDWEKPFMLQ